MSTWERGAGHSTSSGDDLFARLFQRATPKHDERLTLNAANHPPQYVELTTEDVGRGPDGALAAVSTDVTSYLREHTSYMEGGGRCAPIEDSPRQLPAPLTFSIEDAWERSSTSTRSSTSSDSASYRAKSADVACESRPGASNLHSVVLQTTTGPELEKSSAAPTDRKRRRHTVSRQLPDLPSVPCEIGGCRAVFGSNRDLLVHQNGPVHYTLPNYYCPLTAAHCPRAPCDHALGG